MSRNYRFRDQQNPHFISFATVHWVDVFTRSAYSDIVVDSMNYCIKNKGLIVYAWVIMSNHVHMIIGTEGENKMEDIVRDLKKHTSRSILKAIEENQKESRRTWMLEIFKRAGSNNSNNKNYQFWQQHNHPIELFYGGIIDQKLRYLHNNPVKANVVFKPEEYQYSSAMDYVGRKGLVEVRLIE